MLIHSTSEIDHYFEQIRKAAGDVQSWLLVQTGDPLDMLRRMKFDKIGFHPTESHPLNVIEQINQTWTYAVALAATRKLFELHPEAGGFYLAPGAHATTALDIMSVADGLVGAETFAAVDPRNNRKLVLDLTKMIARPENHRYVFFMSPLFPGNKPLPQFGSGGVKVWSVDF
jgi:hypothetical protein